MRNINNEPISIYIHFPWCESHCGYCDFNSYVMPKGGLPELSYINKLIEDLSHSKQFTKEREVKSIFLGGGTPSLFSERSIDTVLSYLYKEFPISDNCEITIEANPSSSEINKFKAFKFIGINRLSLGLQTFSDKQLKLLGRTYSSKQIMKAIEVAKETFNNINFDIMYALPEQTLKDAISDVRKALSFQPTHFSWYQLTVEPNTIFYKSNIKLPQEQLSLDMMKEVQNIINDLGYKRYEVSAYYLDALDYRCKHNLNYWMFGDYLGVGAGAHGKITKINDYDGKIIFSNGRYRKSNQQQIKVLRTEKPYIPEKYLAIDDFKKNMSYVQQDKLLFEIMLNRLRIKERCSKEFIESFGLYWSDVIEKIRPFIDNGLIDLNENDLNEDCQDESIIVTDKGWNMMNEILIELV